MRKHQTERYAGLLSNLLTQKALKMRYVDVLNNLSTFIANIV